MDILIKAAQLVLSLSILIICHEFGHFFFAKLFKVRVEKFYLFFDPWFSLFKFKKGDTEYGLGWLPLGGYVKISGMVDESMDKEAMAQEPKEYEFRSKPAYQRLLIMVGGVVVNFLLAFFIYWMVLFTWGDSYIKVSDATYGLTFSETAKEIGFQDGDIVKSVDNNEVDKIKDIVNYLVVDQGKQAVVDRNGELVTINVPEDFATKVIASKQKMLADFRYPFVVDSVMPKGNADKAGLMKNDQVVAINNNPAKFVSQFLPLVQDNKGKEVNITVLRNGNSLELPCKVNDKGLIGVGYKTVNNYCEVTHVKYGFWEALPAGVSKGVATLASYASQLKFLFTKEGASQVGGFGSIANLFPAAWSWYAFWTLTAFLSIVLGFMNILPIPALDGGHVMFLLYEVITGRKPSDKFLERAQAIGMILLLGLLLFANGNDIFKAIFGS